jgi:AbrB family looped-hinge helix DNA binding protein
MHITAFGEAKPLTAWAGDSRCVVSYSTLVARISRLGWEPTRAITTPVAQPRRDASRRTRVTLDHQNRFVLPVWARRHLGLQEGDALIIDVIDNAVVLVPAPWR